MAYLTGPLHSVTARGQVAKTLIYQTYKNRTYSKKYTTPRNDRTPGQVGIRAMVYFLTRLWKDLPTNDQASWLDQAEIKNYSAFNAYFVENMHRWRDSQGPMTRLQTPPAEAYAPTVAMTATGGDGQVQIEITPAITATEHVTVTGDPTPTPDCLGQYDFFDTHNGKHAYRRAAPATPYRIFIAAGSLWLIVPRDDYVENIPYWWHALYINGLYYPSTGMFGYPIVSEVAPAVYSDPAAAIAIFRQPTTIGWPNRKICRVILTPDAGGNISWTDTGQIGGKPGPAGGLPPGSYHYMAQPLSLDGRKGAATADAEATVT